MQELGALSDTEAAELLYNLSARHGPRLVGRSDARIGDVAKPHSRPQRRAVPGRPTAGRAGEDPPAKSSNSTNSCAATAAWPPSDMQLDREIARLGEEKNQAEHQARVVDLAIEPSPAMAASRRGHGRRAGRPRAANADARGCRPAARRPQRHDRRRRRQRLELVELAAEGAARRSGGVGGQRGAAPARRRASRPCKSRGLGSTALQAQVGRAGKGNRRRWPRQSRPNTSSSVWTADGGRLARRPSARRSATLRSAGPGCAAVPAAARRIAQQAVDGGRRPPPALASQIDAALTSPAGSRIVRRHRPGGQPRRRNSAAASRSTSGSTRWPRCQRELERQSRRLLGRQLLPGWALAGLGAVFVLGVVLVLAGLFMPASITGSLGWALALLGLAGSGAAGLGKIILERSNARQLEACQKQIDMLQLQVKQAGEDRDALDAQLPRGGGPIAARLAAAEKDLAALEELMPAGRPAAAPAEQEAAAARERLVRDRARTRRRAAPLARRPWRQAGLPRGLAPGRLKQSCRRSKSRLPSSSGNCAQRTRGTRPVAAANWIPSSGESRNLSAEAGLDARRRPPGRADSAGLPTRLTRRGGPAHPTPRGQPGASHAAARSGEAEEAVSRLRLRRRQLLREAGCAGRAEFRRRAVEAARAASPATRSRRFGPRDRRGHRRPLLRRRRSAGIPRRRAHVRSWSRSREELLASVGQPRRNSCSSDSSSAASLAEQLKSLAEDRQLGQKQLDLALVEKRLEDALRRWQVLAVTCRMLDAIRSTYEQERQPETLQEASGYSGAADAGPLSAASGRRWAKMSSASTTPRGAWLPVEALSRGTREQLFLSLRLALAACYARRGAPLPLVLGRRVGEFRQRSGRRPPRPCCAISPPPGIRCWSSLATSTCCGCSSRCTRPWAVCPTVATRPPRRSSSRSLLRRSPRGVVVRRMVRAALPPAWQRRSRRKTPAMTRTSSPTRLRTATESRTKKAAARKRRRGNARFA